MQTVPVWYILRMETLAATAECLVMWCLVLVPLMYASYCWLHREGPEVWLDLKVALQDQSEYGEKSSGFSGMLERLKRI